MNTQFINEGDKLIGSLTNEQTAVVSNGGLWIKEETIEYLGYSQLEPFYSIKKGLSNIIEHWKYRQLEPFRSIKEASHDLQISDIDGVHLVSSSGVIVAEQTDLSCIENSELLTIINELVLGLPNKIFSVVIEADCNHTKLSHSFDVEATHILLGVSIALDKLMTISYDEIYDIDDVESVIEQSMRNNDDVVIHFENGNSYKLLSIKTAEQNIHAVSN